MNFKDVSLIMISDYSKENSNFKQKGDTFSHVAFSCFQRDTLSKANGLPISYRCPSSMLKKCFEHQKLVN